MVVNDADLPCLLWWKAYKVLGVASFSSIHVRKRRNNYNLCGEWQLPQQQLQSTSKVCHTCCTSKAAADTSWYILTLGVSLTLIKLTTLRRADSTREGECTKLVSTARLCHTRTCGWEQMVEWTCKRCHLLCSGFSLARGLCYNSLYRPTIGYFQHLALL